MQTDISKKLRSNQVEIEGKVYTKNVGAFLYNNEYRPKNEFRIDSYTNELKHISTLNKYVDPIIKKILYTSNKLVNLYISGHTLKVCKCFVTFICVP